MYKEKYPTISTIALRAFYVDDLLTGANTKVSTELISEGSFELIQWASNCDQILQNVQENTNKTDIKLLTLKKEQIIRTLCLEWNWKHVKLIMQWLWQLCYGYKTWKTFVAKLGG